MRLGMDSLRKVGGAKRVRIEGWRQKRLGSNGRSHREEGENASHHQRRKTCLTLTGPSHGRLEAVISRQIQSPGSKERREFAPRLGVPGFGQLFRARMRQPNQR